MVIKKVHGINYRKCIKGYAYEVGLNDFVISNPNDYVTKIMIKIEENACFLDTEP